MFIGVSHSIYTFNVGRTGLYLLSEKWKLMNIRKKIFNSTLPLSKLKTKAMCLHSFNKKGRRNENGKVKKIDP